MSTTTARHTRAGDLLGRRQVFVFGLAVFAVASLLVGIAPTGWFAIAARALQGVGAAIVAPSSLSLLTVSFPAGKERAKAIALYGATAGIGASLGLVVGGAVADLISWVETVPDPKLVEPTDALVRIASVCGSDRTGLGLGREWGATDVIASRGEEGIATLLDATGGDGTHVVIEAVGHRPAYDMAVGAVRVGGTISRVGVPQCGPSTPDTSPPPASRRTSC